MGTSKRAMNDQDFFPPGLPPDPTRTYSSGGVSLGVSSFWSGEDGLDKTKQIPISDSKKDEGLLLPSGYRLRHIVGRGGFGEVWAAEQTSLCRFVAVKRLHRAKSDLEFASDTARELIAEFRKEAVTSANLEHPNIVPVHDIVMDDAGEPLLSMKLIQGQTWNRQIEADIGKLSVEDHLARHIPILIAVAQAVAFAHSRGVMHRDLKPSQVIIGDYGEVVLGDWGLAVAFDTALLGTHSAVGARGEVPTKFEATNPGGTAAYMAPEQTKHTADGLGPWTDVYLLGGIIFTILTGVPPHNAKTGSRAFEMASKGEISPLDSGPKLGELPEELVSLMYRALEPEPKDRVPSAKEFVAQLQEFLSGAGRRRESIALAESAAAQLALPGGDYSSFAAAEGSLSRALSLWPGNVTARELKGAAIARHAEAALANNDLTLAQLQVARLSDSPQKAKLFEDVRQAVQAGLDKEIQRRRLRTSLRVTGATFVLVSGILGGLAFRSAHRADAEAARATDRAHEATQQRERADARATEAREARDRAEDLVNFLVVDLQDSLVPMGRTSLLKRVAEKSSQYFSQRPTTEMSETELNQYATSQRNMSDIFATLGEMDEARTALETGLAALDDATSADPQAHLALKATLLLRLSSVAQRGIDLEESGRRIEEAAAIIPNIKNEGARRELVLDLLAQRSQLRQRRGDTPGAIALLREGIALARQGEGGSEFGELTSVVSQLYRSLGQCYYSIGQGENAVEAQSRAAALSREAYEARSTNENTVLARELVSSLTGLAQFLYVYGRPTESLATYREALKTSESLAALDPFSAIAGLDLASIRTRYAIALRDQGRYPEAREQCERSVELLSTFAAFPNPEAQLLQELALANSELGRISLETGNTEEARQHLSASVEIRVRLAMQPDASTSMIADASGAYRELGDLQAAEGQAEDALESYHSARTYLERALAADQRSISARRALSDLRMGEADLLLQKDQFDEAIEAMRAALDIADEVKADTQGHRTDLFHSLYVNEILVMAYNAAGRSTEALKTSEYSLVLLEEAAPHLEEDVSFAYSQILAALNRAFAHYRLQDYTAASAILDEAEIAVGEFTAKEPDDQFFKIQKASILVVRSRIEAATTGRARSEELCREALAILDGIPEGGEVLAKNIVQFEIYVHLGAADEARQYTPSATYLALLDAELREKIRELGLWPE